MLEKNKKKKEKKKRKRKTLKIEPSNLESPHKPSFINNRHVSKWLCYSHLQQD